MFVQRNSYVEYTHIAGVYIKEYPRDTFLVHLKMVLVRTKMKQDFLAQLVTCLLSMRL